MKPMAVFKSLFYLAKISTQLGVLFVIYKNRRREAKNSFKQQIIRAGLSSAEAEELARVYPSFPSIRELMRFSRPEF